MSGWFVYLVLFTAVYTKPLVPTGPHSVVILRVIDGDTVQIGLLVPLTIRVQGINAPEINSIEGLRSKDYLKKTLLEGNIYNVWLGQQEKYGRTLGDFLILQRLDWLSNIMVEDGHARRN